MSDAYDVLKLNSLSYQLAPISIRELLFIQQAPCDIYALEDGIYKKIVSEHSILGPNLLKDLIYRRILRPYVTWEGLNKIVELHQKELVQVTRSLSIGNPIDKAKRLLNLLTVNLAHLYRESSNDQMLQLQFQSIKNLASFLLENQSLHPEIFYEYQKQKHHYIYAQPMISALFTIGLLKHSHMFNTKEIETLFAVSYFKDIGMSSIPIEKYELKKLSKSDRRIFLNHPKESVRLLEGRLPLPLSAYKIIEYHHSFSILKNETYADEENEEIVQFLTGIESLIITVSDMIAAMISERPYRAATSLYDSLELIKRLFADQQPQEFKLIVNYFRSFFSSK